MADDVQDNIENALNETASTTERSGNMKKELKQTIYQTVSKLRKLFVTLIDIQNSKNRTIAELEKTLASNKVQIEVAKRSTLTEPSTSSGVARREPSDTSQGKRQAETVQTDPSTPSGDARRDPPRTSPRGAAPYDTSQQKRQAETPQTRLYSDALRGKCKQERYIPNGHI